MNPILTVGLDELRNGLGALAGLRVADHGCGQLRHYKVLRRISRELYLVDTEAQLTRCHQDGDQEFRIVDVAASGSRGDGRKVVAMNTTAFEESRLGLDLVVSVAVMDVVLPKDRRRIAKAIGRNLKPGGVCLLIVPRNDSSILARCTNKNRYYDGYVFEHHGIETFYHNHESTSGLIALFERCGLRLINDLSRYRQVCLCFQRQ